MNDRIRLSLCQINPTVGDLAGNSELIERAAITAFDQGSTLAVFPELALTGYPPEDLVLNRGFVAAAESEMTSLASRISGGVALVGTVEAAGSGLFNSVAVIADGEVRGHARKCRLPNYGVFDEQRYFSAADSGSLIEVDGVRIGVSVCEDIWFAGGPCGDAAESGARLLINCSASPFHRGKGSERLGMLEARAGEHRLPIAWCNLVGGQDEIVFDGQSMAISAEGSLLARAPQFGESIVTVEIELPAVEIPTSPRLSALAKPVTSAPPAAPGWSPTPPAPELGEVEEIEAALMTGLRDYFAKNRFDGVVLGVSGGIDSAVALSLSAAALGPEKVHGVVMPSPWSSTETQDDARTLCGNLGVDCLDLPIDGPMSAFSDLLVDVKAGPGFALAEENIQARIRGNLLMALSNRFGWLVVTTGNKSELAVGYSTLYGDAAGGFAVLKDVPKGLVYELAELRNSREDSPIPLDVIVRPPSAELRPGQLDEDSLPPYPLLDEIIRLYVEERLDSGAIVAEGHDREVVGHVLALIDRSEYKRRQYPPGVKITPIAFGRDRRMPMTNRWTP